MKILIGYSGLICKNPLNPHWIVKQWEQELYTPLDTAEVRHTAKSVAKWTFRNFNHGTFEDYIAKTHTSDMQAFRGKQKGKTKREEGIILLESGASIQEVMQQLKVSRRTVFYWREQA